MSIKKNVQDALIPSEEHHVNLYPMDFEEFLWALGDDMLHAIYQGAFRKKSSRWGRRSTGKQWIFSGKILSLAGCRRL